MAEYIDRKSILNDIGELFTLCYETLPNECGHHFIVEKELETHWDFVKNLPAADVQPVRHGTDISETNEHHCEFMCSVCGAWAGEIAYGTLDGGGKKIHFCPNCGARMEHENG